MTALGLRKEAAGGPDAYPMSIIFDESR